ncbi:MAG: hypothetical protein R3F41_02640 [Gammaproteobacteria bacterium]|nr:hypothetical protein [Pseudomonadales bacterium]MCP5345809.1 hypothetical protein [Pseudomonadales bacterium]
MRLDTLLGLALWVTAVQAFAQALPTLQQPRTEYGFPDFQGNWTNASQTPLQRPVELADKGFYSEEEAALMEREARTRDTEKSTPLSANRSAPDSGLTIRFQADENFANTRVNLMRVDNEYRTSLIVDPPNGRLPYRDNGQQQDIYGRWLAAGAGELDGPEIRNPWERCFFVGGQLPPMIAWTYNANFQIVQNRDYVVIMREMVHDARIIRIGGKPFPESLYQWAGNSIGHWDGDALIVESRNFHPQASHQFIRSSDQFQVVERFELVGPDAIRYRYTVTDPVIYSRPFTVEMTLQRKPAGQILYEYACHEGNYSLPGILAGARREEIAADLAR